MYVMDDASMFVAAVHFSSIALEQEANVKANAIALER
jgi:hypothetical protein